MRYIHQTVLFVAITLGRRSTLGRHFECVQLGGRQIDHYELFQRISARPGATWLTADLHIHTPASHDFKKLGLPPDFDAYQYVSAMQEAGLQLVAITDHSSGEWIDHMKIRARDRRQHGLLVVLPGVEVSAGGVHLILIFPETRDTGFINHILSLLGINPDQRGRKETICSKSVEDVADICHSNGGII